MATWVVRRLYVLWMHRIWWLCSFCLLFLPNRVDTANPNLNQRSKMIKGSSCDRGPNTTRGPTSRSQLFKYDNLSLVRRHCVEMSFETFRLPWRMRSLNESRAQERKHEKTLIRVTCRVVSTGQIHLFPTSQGLPISNTGSSEDLILCVLL